MHRIISYIAVFLLVIFSSCDPSNIFSYQVTNNADTAIVVHLLNNANVDTTVWINKDQTATIYVKIRMESRKGAKYHDVSEDIDKFFAIKRNDTSTRDFISNDSWTFTPKGKHDAIYAATITNNDF